MNNVLPSRASASGRFRAWALVAAIGTAAAGLSVAAPAAANPVCGVGIASWFHSTKDDKTRYTGRIFELQKKTGSDGKPNLEPVGKPIGFKLELLDTGALMGHGQVGTHLVAAHYDSSDAPDFVKDTVGMKDDNAIISDKSISFQELSWHSEYANYRMVPKDCNNEHVATVALLVTIRGKQYGTERNEVLNGSPL